MTELLTAAQMRAVEQVAIESGAVSGLQLMERAGQAVVAAIFEQWPELAGRGASPSGSLGYLRQDETARRAVVLCGPGNNGGDGFVVARLLKQRGWAVEVLLYGDIERLPPDARVNYQRWLALGEGTQRLVEAASGLAGESQLTNQPNLVVDGLFGTGLTRPLAPQLRSALNRLNTVFSVNSKWVAVDIASGICADSGHILGGDDDCFWLDRMSLSVTFHTRKIGHYLASGACYTGKLVCADIGLSNDLTARLGEKSSGTVLPEYKEKVHLTFETWQVAKENDAHKFHHGHALILSGGCGKTGAARLAARGALRIGAGLVTLAVPPAAQIEVACQITAVMLTRLTDADALAQRLQDARLNALCLGPGLGQQRARDMVPVAVSAAHKPYVVLDADALSAYQKAPEQLFAMLHDGCVLTPHEGEFRRLFPDIHAQLVAPPTQGPAYSKVDATRAAAKRAGCSVLFKGADTVIADPSGRCSLNAALYDRAAPWLATAGSGDVLAGFITGLLARGLAPFHAAETAAWLHVEAARQFGPGLIAEDLAEQLPAVFRRLGL